MIHLAFSILTAIFLVGIAISLLLGLSTAALCGVVWLADVLAGWMHHARR